jgi:hypothetical protein
LRDWTSGAARARNSARCLALAALVALAAACGGGGDDGVPDWLNQTYTDGKITIRYPEGWTSDDRSRFGASVGDARNANANAFVAVQYLPDRDYADGAEFGELARQLLKPPDGEGTRLLRTQAARIGGRRGFEAAVLYSAIPGTPLGPTLRVFGIELESGEVAVLVFGAQDPASHRTQFAWIKRTITWN